MAATIMQGGIKLSLLIGPVPVPAPAEVVEALSSVKVEAGSGDTQSGFELTFDLPARSPLAHAVPAHRRRQRAADARRAGGADRRPRRAADRRRDDQCRDAAGRGRRRQAGRQGQGPVAR